MTGREIQVERMNRGKSRRALARELNVPEQTLRRIERGEGISLGYAKALADWLGVQVLDILPLDEEAAA